MAAPPPRTPRVNALDAQQLDADLATMLGQQCRRIFALSSPTVAATFSHELDLLLSTLIFHFTVNAHQPSPGQRMQNVQLAHASDAASLAHSAASVDEKASVTPLVGLAALAAPMIRAAPLSPRARAAFYALSVLLPYLSAKFQALMTLESWFASESRVKRAVYRTSESLSSVHRLASLLNSFVFLVDGRYVSLAHRALALQFTWLNARAQRQLAFDLMHQQLAFAVLREFTATVTPLLPIEAVKRASLAVHRFIFTPSAATLTPSIDSRQSFLTSLDAGLGCPICGRSAAVNCHLSEPCMHSYCYYCIASHWQRFWPTWRCATCDDTITGFTAWSERREEQRKQLRNRKLHLDAADSG